MATTTERVLALNEFGVPFPAIAAIFDLTAAQIEEVLADQSIELPGVGGLDLSEGGDLRGSGEGEIAGGALIFVTKRTTHGGDDLAFRVSEHTDTDEIPGHEGDYLLTVDQGYTGEGPRYPRLAAWTGRGDGLGETAESPGNVVSWYIDARGNEIALAKAAPSDADIAAGECFAWWDGTKFIRRARTKVGPRAYQEINLWRGAWSAEETYSSGQYVTHEGETYKSKKAGNTNHAVGVEEWWEPTPTEGQLVQNTATFAAHANEKGRTELSKAELEAGKEIAAANVQAGSVILITVEGPAAAAATLTARSAGVGFTVKGTATAAVHINWSVTN